MSWTDEEQARARGLLVRAGLSLEAHATEITAFLADELFDRAEAHPVIDHDPSDTSNRFCVGSTVAGALIILRPPTGQMNKAAAVNLAAWLVAISGASTDEVEKAVRAILST